MPHCRVHNTTVHAAALSCLGLCAAAAIAICGVAGIGEKCTVYDMKDVYNSQTYQGTCIKVKDCTSKGWGSASGYCRGPNEDIPEVQCCVNAACSALDGTPGICISTNKTFDEQCQGGRFVPAGTAACPFNKRHSGVGTIQCCIHPKGTASDEWLIREA